VGGGFGKLGPGFSNPPCFGIPLVGGGVGGGFGFSEPLLISSPSFMRELGKYTPGLVPSIQ